MYNALACFICARSIVFCQNFWRIKQQLPDNWIGEGSDFHGLLGGHSLFPCVSPSCVHYFQAPATQAKLTNSAEWTIYDWLNCRGTNQLTEWLVPNDWLNNNYWVSTYCVMHWITEILYDWLYCPGTEQLNWLNDFRLIELSRDWPTDWMIYGWLIG